MNKYFLYLFFLLISISSCKVDTEKFLMETSWGIQEINFNGEKVQYTFLSNLIYFEENNVCEVPLILDIEQIDKKDRLGKWSYNKETQKLTIESKNPYLNGEFDVCFEKNLEYKRIMLVLTSDNIHLKASKGITQYQGDGGNLPILCENK